MRRPWPAMIVLLMWGCNGSDALGPVERGIRSLLGAWDMWETEAVQPYEGPLAPGLAESVPISGLTGYPEALAQLRALPPGGVAKEARISYQRYCRHCHGYHGDNRIIVGESFSPALPDLRSTKVQAKSDQALFQGVAYGQRRMIPLINHTATALEILLALQHVRDLRNAPSLPYFPRKFAEPIEPLGEP